jgi:HEAT repeat protein
MSELQDQTSVDLQSGGPGAAVDDDARETARQIEEFISALLKDYRARQAYSRGNQLIDRFHEGVLDQLHATWQLVPHLTLTIDEGRFLWNDLPVYDQPIGHDNLAFMFFRDGLRTLAFLPGCELGELREFVEIIASQRRGQADLLASLWHRDFTCIRMDYVDVGEDENLNVPSGNRNAGAGETIPDMSEVERVVADGPVGADVDDAFNKILLSEADKGYLQGEIELELERELQHGVTLALLDQFEMRDQERRTQVVDVLRRLLPRLLATPDFATAALIVNELQLLANRTGERDTQELVASLLRDMSEAMAHLVANPMEESAATPRQEEIQALLGALQAEAIPTLVRALPAIADDALRDQIEGALEGLVAQSPEQLTALLTAEDPMLAAEAANILARLGVVEAVPDVLQLARRTDVMARRAAIEALAYLETDEAGPVLFRALDDHDWTVRKSALQSIARVVPTGTGIQLRQRISNRQFSSRDEVEQMAFLRTLVAAGPDEAIPELSRLLNARRRWGSRQPAIVRAGAARALALVGTPLAATELARASNDRNPSVAEAVRLCLRHLEQNVGTLPEGTDS